MIREKRQGEGGGADLRPQKKKKKKKIVVGGGGIFASKGTRVRLECELCQVGRIALMSARRRTRCDLQD